MGCDERGAVHCGNPGAAATGSSSLGSGAGRRGRARGARAGSEKAGGRAGGPAGARRERARAAERAQAGHLAAAAAAAAAEPPRKCRAGLVPREPGPRRSLGAGRRAPSRRRAREWLAMAHRGGARLSSGRWTPSGPRPASLRQTPVQALPARAAREFHWFCSKSKPGNELLSETHPLPASESFCGKETILAPPRPPCRGWARGRGRPGGAGGSAWARASGAIVCGVVLGLAPARPPQ